MKTKEENNYWISYADIMSALMFIFLFIAVITLTYVPSQVSNNNDIIDNYTSTKEDLYFELYNEFKYDLEKWHAKINRQTLTLSFHEPNILFEKGKDNIKPLFKSILDDFYPRYVKILSQDKFKNNILEVRIEGHTSSEWNKNSTVHTAYIANMKLSQNRTSCVLGYVLSMENLKNYDWIRNNIIAVGYSSSQLKINNNKENKIASRRVEFRVITDSESKLYEIIKNKKKQRDDYYTIDVKGKYFQSH